MSAFVSERSVEHWIFLSDSSFMPCSEGSSGDTCQKDDCNTYFIIRDYRLLLQERSFSELKQYLVLVRS